MGAPTGAAYSLTMDPFACCRGLQYRHRRGPKLIASASIKQISINVEPTPGAHGESGPLMHAPSAPAIPVVRTKFDLPDLVRRAAADGVDDLQPGPGQPA